MSVKEVVLSEVVDKNHIQFLLYCSAVLNVVQVTCHCTVLTPALTTSSIYSHNGAGVLGIK